MDHGRRRLRQNIRGTHHWPRGTRQDLRIEIRSVIPTFCSGSASGHGLVERCQCVIVVLADMIGHERIRSGRIEDHRQRELHKLPQYL